MAVTDIVGQTVALSIAYFDQNGQPMAVAPDAAPVWGSVNPEAETITVSPDGLTASAHAIAPGNDEISVSLNVGGKAYSAVLGVVVSPQPQVLTTIAIVATDPQ